MRNKDYSIVGLYEHNIESYKEIESAYNLGQDVVGIVHATGTGKTYNALQLIYDNQDKMVVYVVPSNGIIEHIYKIINDNPNLDIKRDFKNVEFRTYQSFISLSKDEIKDIKCDLLILDEFHHIGAPIWGERINTIIETHPKMKIFGMTAYTIRDRKTSYERDMANPNKEEIFSNKIVSRYDLCDAMIDGVLPKPIYKTAYVNLIEKEKIIEEKVNKLPKETEEYQEYMKVLSNVKKKIHEAPSILNILKKTIKTNGKYIYFCPPMKEEGTNDIETVKKQVVEMLKNFIKEEDIVIYTSTSEMGYLGRQNRKAFYDDVTLEGEKVENKLRIMFAINQYNEGIHAPNIDGVIMGRGTTSDIVYFEQLGRALSVRGNTKEKYEELEKYPKEYLIKMCNDKDIPIKDEITKEELIEKLIAPVVIDLTNNYCFIKELENNLKERIKEIKGIKKVSARKRDIKIKDASFDIEIENQDIFETLKYVMDKVNKSWYDYYELAKAYYEHHGNLEVKQSFKTNNGYIEDVNGKINLGIWIAHQRRTVDKLSERGKLLSEIGMRFENKISTLSWEEMYTYAKIYYEHHGNLEVKQGFKTNNGYIEDKNGKINLGVWITHQRKVVDELSERGKLLSEIGMRFEKIKSTLTWEEMYTYAKIYYEHHGNLEIKQSFKTNNGYIEDVNGKIYLGIWIATQRKVVDKLSERGKLLSKIGMRFKDKKSTLSWEEIYTYAKAYYEHHGNLEVKVSFKTNNGYIEDINGKINLGMWIATQRQRVEPSSKRGKLLSEIGMRFERIKSTLSWKEMYTYAKAYYEHHGNLEVKESFKTNNGYIEDINGKVILGTWIVRQKNMYNGKIKGNFTLEQIKSLEDIKIKWFSDNINEKLQREEITLKNIKQKQIELKNRLYSLLNKYDDELLPTNEELNTTFLDELDIHKKVLKK